ncbi:MAG: type II toxin-antitoxin system RelE/ParE family toxin [Spirochaetes bacterium]|nr:type II toxin-antitoxin system RelE/ParE family toxin [Spirochaetota bacterium]
MPGSSEALQLKTLKQLRKIKDYYTRETIYNAVDDLKNFPNCSNVKKLKDRDEYRLRVGRWRVFFTKSFEILYIEEVKIRNENTY